MPKKERLGIRTDESLKGRIQKLAEKENRSMSNWIEYHLQDMVERFEEEEAKAILEDEIDSSQKSHAAKRRRGNA